MGSAEQAIVRQEPEEAARALVAALDGRDVADWVGRLVTELEGFAGRDELNRVMAAWGLSKADTARMFGVSRQALGKWLDGVVPPERRPVLADLAAATDLLARYLKRERIPAVVRRPAERLGGTSLLELARSGRSGEVLTATRQFFDLRRAVS